MLHLLNRYMDLKNKFQNLSLRIDFGATFDTRNVENISEKKKRDIDLRDENSLEPF